MRKSARPARLLVIDDQPRTADLLKRLAPDLILLAPDESGRGHARSWDEAEQSLGKSRPPDLVILDLRFEIPDADLLPDRRELGESAAGRRDRRLRRDRQGLYIFERLRRLHPDLPVIVTTAHEEIPFEEEALRLKADAFAYTVGEDEATGEGLLRLIRHVLSERDAPISTGRFFWGRSAAMRELRRRITSLAPAPLPLLVTGPTGTGKNFLVREVIHPLSGRKGPLVGFDCATVPESLLPAALFGSVRGAYTGAVVDRPGFFETAANGTLFLDEIENLSPDAQKLLLTALNDGVVRRIGATSETPHTARVVAASNVSLKLKVRDGSFRSDLLMRLNPALALELPALAERREDLPDLAAIVANRFFSDTVHRREIAAQVRAAGGPDPEPAAAFDLVTDEESARTSSALVLFALPHKAWLAVTKHAWPGNLRQFEMVLSDLLSAALYGGGGGSLDRRGRVVFAVDPRLLFQLLAEAEGDSKSHDARLVLPRPQVTTVEAFRRELERSAFRWAFHETRGDFAAMAELFTGSRVEERAVRLRFNRLGLSVRSET
jgi:DNA-binding NtrC family response regulator